MLFEFSAAAVVIIVMIVFCFRLMRRGITSLDQDKAKYLAQISGLRHLLAEDQRNVSLGENLQLAHAAVRDILRLAGAPKGWRVARQGTRLDVDIPGGGWTVSIDQPSYALRRTNKVMQGRPRWKLSGSGTDRRFEDIGDLMGHLDTLLRERLAGVRPPQAQQPPDAMPPSPAGHTPGASRQDAASPG